VSICRAFIGACCGDLAARCLIPARGFIPSILLLAAWMTLTRCCRLYKTRLATGLTTFSGNGGSEMDAEFCRCSRRRPSYELGDGLYRVTRLRPVFVRCSA